MTTRCK